MRNKLLYTNVAKLSDDRKWGLGQVFLRAFYRSQSDIEIATEVCSLMAAVERKEEGLTNEKVQGKRLAAQCP